MSAAVAAGDRLDVPDTLSSFAFAVKLVVILQVSSVHVRIETLTIKVVGRSTGSRSAEERRIETMVEPGAEALIGRLRNVVDRHSVRYEVWPAEELVNGKVVKVGFELQLYGTHEHGETRLTPGCERCVQTFQDLREIADWIMPKEERASRYEVEPYHSALSLSPTRGLRAEVVLTVKIVHRHGFFQPIDDCEQRCLAEMRTKLVELGVRQGN